MSQVRLELLGGFSLQVDDRTLLDEAWRRSKAKALLKLLAIAPGHRLHREQVIDLVWPDLPPQRAVDQLYKAVHFIRAQTTRFGLAPIVRTADERMELADIVAVDVDGFRELARQARATRERSAYRRALAACPGDLLPDDRLEEWTEPAREELASLRRDLQLELLQADEERGEGEAAIALARSMLQSDPASEPAHRALMRLLAACPDRRRAGAPGPGSEVPLVTSGRGGLTGRARSAAARAKGGCLTQPVTWTRTVTLNECHGASHTLSEKPANAVMSQTPDGRR